MKLEVIVIPVSDVDRAKQFYGGLGWRFDADFPPVTTCARSSSRRPAPAPRSSSARISPRLRPAPLRDYTSSFPTSRPPARSCSVAAWRSARRSTTPVTCTLARTSPTCSEYSGQRSGSRASQLPLVRLVQRSGRQRLAVPGSHRAPPGRVDADTTFTSAADLAATLRRAAAAHGEHEKRTGEHDVNWPDWYAEYIVNEQAGKPLPH